MQHNILTTIMFLMTHLTPTHSAVIDTCGGLKDTYTNVNSCCSGTDTTKLTTDVYHDVTHGKDTVVLYQKFQPKIPMGGMPDKSSMCDDMELAPNVTLGATLNDVYKRFGFQCSIALNFSSLTTVDAVFTRLQQVSNVQTGDILSQGYNTEEHTLLREYTFKSWNDFKNTAISPPPGGHPAWDSFNYKLMVMVPFVWAFNLVDWGFKVPQENCAAMKSWLTDAKASWSNTQNGAPAWFDTLYTSDSWTKQTVTCYDTSALKSNDNRMYP